MWVELSATDKTGTVNFARATTDYRQWALTADKKSYPLLTTSLNGSASAGHATFSVPAATTTITASLTTKAVVEDVAGSSAPTIFQGPPATFTATLS